MSGTELPAKGNIDGKDNVDPKDLHKFEVTKQISITKDE